MKYKIKNVTTGEETLCEKVEVGGWIYYVYGKAIEGDYGYLNFQGGEIKIIGKYFPEDWLKVIAITNSSLNLPIVIDEVYEKYQEDSFEIGVDGQSSLTAYVCGYSKAKETYQYTKEDMVEWFNWCENHKRKLNEWKVDNIKGAELFNTDQLFKEWQEQRIITINVK